MTRQVTWLLRIAGHDRYCDFCGLRDMTGDKSIVDWRTRQVPSLFLIGEQGRWWDYIGQDKQIVFVDWGTRPLTLLSLREMSSDKTILDWGTWEVEAILDWGTRLVTQQMMSYIGQDKWPLDQETRQWTSLKWVKRQDKWWVNCGLKHKTSDGVYYWLRDKTSDWVLCALRYKTSDKSTLNDKTSDMTIEDCGTW